MAKAGEGSPDNPFDEDAPRSAPTGAKKHARHLVQLLLPLKRGDANRAGLTATRQELVDRFGGVTAYERSPAQGIWSSPDNREERDEVIMVEVLVDEFDTDWWRLYAEQLARRFEEDEIHVRALPALVP